jgi:hypothetical protein
MKHQERCAITSASSFCAIAGHPRMLTPTAQAYSERPVSHGREPVTTNFELVFDNVGICCVKYAE